MINMGNLYVSGSRGTGTAAGATPQDGAVGGATNTQFVAPSPFPGLLVETKQQQLSTATALKIEPTGQLTFNQGAYFCYSDFCLFAVSLGHHNQCVFFVNNIPA